MAKKRWFRFHTDAWLNGTFGLSPNEIAAMITILCELYDHEGLVKPNVPLWARRCSMRPSSFQAALNRLLELGKLELVEGFITSKSVTEEIQTREKLGEKSGETRKKLAEKRNEIRQIREKAPSNTEDRIQNSNLRCSALPLTGSGKGETRERQLHLHHPIDGGIRSSENAIADLRARQALRGVG